jgi:hypothetical protein
MTATTQQFDKFDAFKNDLPQGPVSPNDTARQAYEACIAAGESIHTISRTSGMSVETLQAFVDRFEVPPKAEKPKPAPEPVVAPVEPVQPVKQVEFKKVEPAKKVEPPKKPEPQKHSNPRSR